MDIVFRIEGDSFHSNRTFFVVKATFKSCYKLIDFTNTKAIITYIC